MRFVQTFLLALVLLLLSPLGAFAQSFPDVPEGSVFFGGVTYLQQKGIISGYPDGTFKPDQTINRAEALKIAMLASGDETGESLPSSFPDVTTEDWFYDYVQVALTRDVIEGYEDGSFKPGNNINVAESMKIIFLAFGADVGAPPGADPYPDVDQLAWYSAYAQYAKDRQLIWPQDDGKLHAGRDITRGEFADLIYRYMYVEENDLQKFPLSTDWQTFVHPDGEYSVKYPFGWQQIQANGQIIFWKQDEDNKQLSWARIFPNSATVVLAVDDNEEGLSLDQYFARIEYDSSASIQSQTLNTYPFKSVYMADTTTFDYYFEMPDGDILVAYSQIGEGLNKPQLVEEVRNLVGSIRNYDGPTPAASPDSSSVTDTEKFLSQVRENILVDDKAQEMVGLMGDAIIIETDTIGIGTGPVDYYYSATYDATLKVERDSNTLLALSEEKGTAF